MDYIKVSLLYIKSVCTSFELILHQRKNKWISIGKYDPCTLIRELQIEIIMCQYISIKTSKISWNDNNNYWWRCR